jgi:acyl-CoA thioesterase FadM
VSDPHAAAAGTAFSADYRVRFDEAGPDGRIRTSTLLRYAQDVAWRHSEARGFDRAWYAARGLSWVVRSLTLDVRAPIAMGETLRLTTRVIGHRRIWARRLAEVRLVAGEGASSRPDSGSVGEVGRWESRRAAPGSRDHPEGGEELLARAVTDWVILDLRGRPVRIPSDFGLDFASPELHEDIQRAELPVGEPRALLPLRVRPQDLDPVGHVNNAAYLDWLEEAHLAADHAATVVQVPRSVVIEYLASAGPGDEVAVATWAVDRRWQARITDGQNVVLRASGRSG